MSWKASLAAYNASANEASAWRAAASTPHTAQRTTVGTSAPSSGTAHADAQAPHFTRPTATSPTASTRASSYTRLDAPRAHSTGGSPLSSAYPPRRVGSLTPLIRYRDGTTSRDGAQGAVSENTNGASSVSRSADSSRKRASGVAEVPTRGDAKATAAPLLRPITGLDGRGGTGNRRPWFSEGDSRPHRGSAHGQPSDGSRGQVSGSASLHPWRDSLYKQTPQESPRQQPHRPPHEPSAPAWAPSQRRDDGSPSVTAIEATSPAAAEVPSAMSSSPLPPFPLSAKPKEATSMGDTTEERVTPRFFRDYRERRSQTRADDGTAALPNAPAVPSHVGWVGLQVHLRARTQGTKVTVLDLTSFHVECDQWRWFCRDVLPGLHVLEELILVDMALTDADMHELLVHGCKVGRLEDSDAPAAPVAAAGMTTVVGNGVGVSMSRPSRRHTRAGSLGALPAEHPAPKGEGSPTRRKLHRRQPSSVVRASSGPSADRSGALNQSPRSDLVAQRSQYDGLQRENTEEDADGGAACRSILPRLRVMDLSQNAFTHRSANHIGKFLLWAADTLTELRLAGNALGDYGLRVLAIYLSKLNLPTLRSDPQLFPDCLAAQCAARIRESYKDRSTLAARGSGGDSRQLDTRMAALRIGPSCLDLRNCRASARGVSEALAGASRTHRVTRVLLSGNVPGVSVPLAAWSVATASTPMPPLVQSGALLAQPPFSSFIELDYPNHLSDITLAHVPLSQTCSPAGCRELLLNCFFCCPQLDRLILAGSFTSTAPLVKPSAAEALIDMGRRQQALEHELRGPHAQASWQLFLEEEGAVNFSIEDGAVLCGQTRVGDVLAELIAQAAFNASVRQRPVPPAFTHLRELNLSATGLTDMAVRGICIALRSAAKSSFAHDDSGAEEGNGDGEGALRSPRSSISSNSNGGTGMLQSLAILDVTDNFLTASGCVHLLYGFLVDWPPKEKGCPSALVSVAMEGNAGVRGDDGTGDVAEVARGCRAAVAQRQAEIAAAKAKGAVKGLPLTLSFGPHGTSASPPPVCVVGCDSDGEEHADRTARPERHGLSQQPGVSQRPDALLPPTATERTGAGSTNTVRHTPANQNTPTDASNPPHHPSHHRSLLSALVGDGNAPEDAGEASERVAASTTARIAGTLYPPQPSMLEDSHVKKEDGAAGEKVSTRLVSPSPHDEGDAAGDPATPATPPQGQREKPQEGGQAAGKENDVDSTIDREHERIRRLVLEMPLENTVNKFDETNLEREEEEGADVGGGTPPLPSGVPADGASPPPRVEAGAIPILAPPPPPSPPTLAVAPSADTEAPRTGEHDKDGASDDAQQQVPALSGDEAAAHSDTGKHPRSWRQPRLVASGTAGSPAAGVVSRMRTFFLTYLHPPGHLFCHAMRVLQSPDARIGPAARHALETDLLSLLTPPSTASSTAHGDAEDADPTAGGPQAGKAEPVNNRSAEAGAQAKVKRVCIKYDDLVASGTMRLEVTCNERRAVIAQRLQAQLATEEPEAQERLFARLMSVLATVPGWDTVEEVMTITQRSSHAHDIVQHVYDGSPTLAVHQHHGAEDTARLIAVLREADNQDGLARQALTEREPSVKEFSPFADGTGYAAGVQRRQDAVGDVGNNEQRQASLAQNNRGFSRPNEHYAHAGEEGNGDGEAAARPHFNFARLDLYTENSEDNSVTERKRTRSWYHETSMTDPDLVAARADALDAFKTSPDASPLFGQSQKDGHTPPSDMDSPKRLKETKRKASPSAENADWPPRPQERYRGGEENREGGTPADDGLAVHHRYPSPPHDLEDDVLPPEPPTTKNNVPAFDEREGGDGAADVLSDVLSGPPAEVVKPAAAVAASAPSPRADSGSDEEGGGDTAHVDETAAEEIPPPIRVKRDAAALTGRTKLFAMSYAHSEGGVVCRGWRLLSPTVAMGAAPASPAQAARTEADRREAQQCLQDDFLALLQPPDEDLEHAVESVSIPFADVGVSSMLPLHVTTNERRATIANRLQATTLSASGSHNSSVGGLSPLVRSRRGDASAAAASPTGTGGVPAVTAAPDAAHFPRLARFLAARAARWDTLSMVEAYLAAPARAELQRRLIQSYRGLGTMVHYHHGTTSALVRELGVPSIEALESVEGNGDDEVAGGPVTPQEDTRQPVERNKAAESLDGSPDSSASLEISEHASDSVSDKINARRREDARPTPGSASFPRRSTGGEEEMEAGSVSGLVVSPLTASPNPSMLSSLQQQQQHQHQQQQQAHHNKSARKDLSGGSSSHGGMSGAGGDRESDKVQLGEQELPADVTELQRQLQNEGKGDARDTSAAAPSGNGRPARTPPPNAPGEPPKSEWDRLLENKHKRLLRMAYDSMAAGAIPLDMESQDRVRVAKGKWEGQRVQLTLEWEIFLVLYFEKPRSFGSTRRALMLVHPVAIGFHAARGTRKGEGNHLVMEIHRPFEADNLGVSMAALAQRLDEGAELTGSGKKTKLSKKASGKMSADTSLVSEDAGPRGSNVARGTDTSATGWMGKDPYTRRLLNPMVLMDIELKSSSEVDAAVEVLNNSIHSATRAIEKSMEASGVAGGPNRGRARPAGSEGGTGLTPRTPTVPQ